MYYAYYFAGELSHVFAETDTEAMEQMRKDKQDPMNDIVEYVPVWDSGKVYESLCDDACAQIECFGKIIY